MFELPQGALILELADVRAAAVKKVAPVLDPSVRRLLIIDDDTELCELLIEYLQPEGFRVDVLHSGTLGVEKALTREYSLIILDVMLPGLRGFEVLQKIRANSRVPVIMLTARGEDVDRILGLEIGADDYLPKPFNPRELAARIQAVLRRAGSPSIDSATPPEEALRLGDLEIRPASRTAFRQNHQVDLTTVEFDLLKVFLSSPGVVIERERLAREVLGRDFNPFDRSIDVHVSNLRRKLGRPPDGSDRIKAVRSVGYLYAVPVKGKVR
jgi:two-component system response regulator CpxR